MSVKLSVCFFTFNRSGYLAHAISEFINNCSLDRKEYEIIISDDGSNELHKSKILEIQKSFGIEKVLWNEHKGMGNNFNAGLREASGKYLLHLEDDWALQSGEGNTLKRSLAFLEQHPEVSIVRLSPLQKIDPLSGLESYGEGFHKIKNDLNMYSNNPHLKRKDFHKYYQWYKEGCPPPESEMDFCDLVEKLGLTICWSGNVFTHFGCISASGDKWRDLNDTMELVYNSSTSRDELLNIAQIAMADNKVFLARHALETFKNTGECDPQIEQSLEIVSEICKQTECVG